MLVCLLRDILLNMSIEGSPSRFKRSRFLRINNQAYRELCLNRLRRLIRLQKEYGYQMNDKGNEYLRKTIFLVYCDCRSSELPGLVEEANSIILRTPSTKERVV